MRRPAPTRRATSAVPEAVPPPRATSDRLQYETRGPRILLTKGSRPSSQFSASPRLSHARLFQVEVANSGNVVPGPLPAGAARPHGDRAAIPPVGAAALPGKAW